MNGFAVVPCEEILYRAVTRRGWLDPDTNRVKADAFFRRADEESLSVFIASVCTPQECAATFNRCFGVYSLHTGKVRTLNLDVVQDEPQHAGIIGLPDPQERPLEAERLAGLLAKQARRITDE